MEDDDEFGDLYTDALQPFASSPIPNSSRPTISGQVSAQQDTEFPDADSNPLKEPDVDIDKDIKFDIEEDVDNNAIADAVIPGLSTDAAGGHGDERGEGDDDWDSDSEDDLQIVLNDNNNLTAMERGGTVVDDGGGGDDEDGVAGGDPNHGAEEQDWGENITQPVEGERKDHIGEPSKGIGVTPKIGYIHQVFHPSHSQFRYVRPGATPMPGATTSAPGGPPGQIRPLANMNLVAGRGRGDWRPAGIKGPGALQKGFHAGRGFGGGLEFTLPSHKTIFDVDIDSFEEKPWKYPGVDVSVFFNFDFNEDSWKDYCKHLEKLCLGSTMQSKIRVYESGRTEQDYDPDLPPELAAATGIHDDPGEIANSVKSNVGQSDLIKDSGCVRPPIPTGRAIQVEGGYGERLPSIDTRPSRIRDSDAIIEIVLQDTADDDSSAGIDVQDQSEGGEPQQEAFTEEHVAGREIPRLKPEYFDGFPQDYNGQKRELAGRRMPFMNSSPAHMLDEDENLPFPQKEPIDYSDSRQIQGRVHGRSPHITPSREMAIVDNKKEESVESMEGRCSALLSSVIKDASESSVENKDAELEETGTVDGSYRLEKEDNDLNTAGKRDTLKDELAETEKLTSQVEQPVLDEGDDWEDPKAARSSDNSKARSASSRETLPFPQKEPVDYSDSKCQTPRQIQGRVHGRSPHITPSREMAMVDNQKEESDESMEGRCSALLSSPVIKDASESSVENKDAELEETGTADGSYRLEKEDNDLNTAGKRDTLKDELAETEKLTSQVEQPLLDEGVGWEDPKAARSSDNSKARSASSRDYQKQQEGFEEEVVQDPRSMHLGSIRRQPDANEQVLHRSEHGGRQESERNHMVIRSREESYPYKDRHPTSAHQLHTKIDGFGRQKDRDSSDMDWARREDDLISRRVRNDEPRKKDRGKVRENERTDKYDDLHSRKELDNGSYRVPYDKDVGSRVLRHRERGDGLKRKHEAVEDFHSKRRKDEKYLRREHIDKEEILHGYRQNAGWHKRERGEVDPRKRDDHQRSRDNFDGQHAAMQKDEAWLLREKGDRQRDREVWHRRKQSHHEEHPSKREIEGWNSLRSRRGAEEKTWVGHVKAKDEHKDSEKDYQSREAMRVRHRDQLKRRDRIQGESPHNKGRNDVSARENQYSSEERRSRQERSRSRSGRVANASDNQRVNERKHKEGSRKSKEPVVCTLSSLGMSKKSQENQSGGQINEKGLKGSGDEEHAEHEIPGHRLSRKQREDISSDDEQQDSQRGGSKLECRTSNKERDFSIGSKSSSSLKFKDIDKDNNDASSEAGKPVDESSKIVYADNQHLLPVGGKDSIDMESKNADTKGFGDRHLDTVDKLKNRNEQFKLPMPSEKEALVIKKLESEPLPSAKSENPVDPEVKQERPARKRRWITN